MNLDTLPEFASREKVTIADIYVEPEIEGGYANAWINVEVENHTREDQDVFANIVVKLGEAQEQIEVVETVPPEGAVISAVIRIEEPEIWWPYGYGEQTLYTCMVGLQVKAEVQDVAEQKFGVRSIRMLEQDDANVLLVNSEEITCDASVWAPSDQFVARASEARYKRLIEEALEAGALMIRAWGEGSEEDSAFYNACDEMGLMVWQELVPRISTSIDEEFAEMAVSEVSEHVKSLRNHPSIVVWCGSMNSESAESNKLVQEIIPKALEELDKTRPYFENCTLPE